MKIGIIQHICNNWQGKALPYTQRRAEKRFAFMAEVGDFRRPMFCGWRLGLSSFYWVFEGLEQCRKTSFSIDYYPAYPPFKNVFPERVLKAKCFGKLMFCGLSLSAKFNFSGYFKLIFRGFPLRPPVRTGAPLA